MLILELISLKKLGGGVEVISGIFQTCQDQVQVQVVLEGLQAPAVERLTTVLDA